MLFTTETISNEEIKSINNFFEAFEGVNEISSDEFDSETIVSLYNSSLTTGLYAKSVEDIANTKMGNKRTRKRNLQQIMQESFFSGANRFGNNFIA